MYRTKHLKGRKSQLNRQINAVHKQILSNNSAVPKKCPYCGGRMIVKKMRDVYPKNTRPEQLICVCENFSTTCTCSVKLKKARDGKILTLGVPADNNLKSLRCEAHHYLEYLVDLNIVDSRRDAAHNWLAHRLGISAASCHIIQFGEENCKMAIKIILNTLKNHPEKTAGKIKVYHSRFEGVESYSDSCREISSLLREIIRFPMLDRKNIN